ncbi:unnamed protein product [Eretmochelys imbricata]
MVEREKRDRDGENKETGVEPREWGRRARMKGEHRRLGRVRKYKGSYSKGSQRCWQLPCAHPSELAEDGSGWQQLGEGFSSGNWSATAAKMENTNALSLSSPVPGPATRGSVA